MKVRSINRVLRFFGVLLVVTTGDNSYPTTFELVTTKEWERRVTSAEERVQP
jgi:hypothetical protein